MEFEHQIVISMKMVKLYSQEKIFLIVQKTYRSMTSRLYHVRIEKGYVNACALIDFKFFVSMCVYVWMDSLQNAAWIALFLYGSQRERSMYFSIICRSSGYAEYQDIISTVVKSACIELIRFFGRTLQLDYNQANQDNLFVFFKYFLLHFAFVQVFHKVNRSLHPSQRSFFITSCQIYWSLMLKKMLHVLFHHNISQEKNEMIWRFKYIFRSILFYWFEPVWYNSILQSLSFKKLVRLFIIIDSVSVSWDFHCDEVFEVMIRTIFGIYAKYENIVSCFLIVFFFICVTSELVLHYTITGN